MFNFVVLTNEMPGDKTRKHKQTNKQTKQNKNKNDDVLHKI